MLKARTNRKGATSTSLFMLCTLLLISLSTSAATHEIPIGAFNTLTSFFLGDGLEASPDGRFIAYTLQNRTGNDARFSSPDLSGIAGCTIWIADIQTGTTHPLTSSQEWSSAPAWSPDGTKLAFYSNHNGTLELRVWDRLTGAVRTLTDTHVPPVTLAPQWIPDGNAIIAEFEDSTLENTNVSLPISTDPEKSGPIVFSYTPMLHVATLSSGSLMPLRPSPYHTFIGLVAITGTPVVHRLGADPKGGTPAFAVSPSGTQIAMVYAVAKVMGTFANVYNLDVVDIRTGEYRTLVKGIRSEKLPQPRWSSDGHIGYVAGTAKYDTGGEHILGTVNIVDVPSGRIATQALQSVRPQVYPRWDASGKIAYIVDRSKLWRYERGRFALIANVRGHELLDLVPRADGRIWLHDATSLNVVARDSATKREGIERLTFATGTLSPIAVGDIHLALTSGPRRIGAVALSNGTFALEAESAIHPQELWTADTSGAFRQIGETNPQLLKYQFGKSTVLQWHSARGELLRGGLLLPVGYQASRRYPLVAFAYGFANGSDAVNTFGLAGFNMQLLASRGYAVLFPDQPIRLGHHREDITEDVVSGVKEAVRRGYADEHRVAVMGQSAGGYAVAAIITKTTLFKAAIMANGATDLISFYLTLFTPDSSFGIDWLEGLNGAIGTTLWARPDLYFENTPVLHLDHVQTPLLILQGTADNDEVPTQQADEMFVGLRRLNKEVTYVRYPGEGHVELDYTPLDQEDWWSRIFVWLDRHLR